LTDFIAELRLRTDVVGIISQTVQLKKRGSRYIGLCPFHNEKTPSFTVDPEQGLYHCFGCKAGGDIIRFVRDTERLEFIDAVKYLAEKANMVVPENGIETRALQAAKTEREEILALNKRAAAYFHSLLWTDAGRPYLDYFHRRGFDDAMIRRFGLGAAPASGAAIVSELASGADDVQTMVKAGLAISRDGGAIGFFRARAMFPIISARGEVLGFGGRILGDGQPKYLNTGDTPVFNKRLNVYGANWLRQEKKLSQVILVEGYMDALSLLANGVKGVAATLGTSLTQEQAMLLSRYAPEVWICYDADDAGQNATLRALDVIEASKAKLNVRVVNFPVGKDPDDYIRSLPAQDRAAQFMKLAKLSPVRFRLKRLIRGFDMSDNDQRTKFAIEAGKVLALAEPVEQYAAIEELAVTAGFPAEVLERQVKSVKPVGATASVARGMQKYPAHSEEQTPNTSLAPAESTAVKAARNLLYFLSKKKDAGRYTNDVFLREDHRAIADKLREGKNFAAIVSEFDKEKADWKEETIKISRMYEDMVEPTGDELDKIVADCLAELRIESNSADIKILVGEIGSDPTNVSTEEIRKMRELEKMVKQSKRL
jgi:DNA primase